MATILSGDITVEYLDNNRWKSLIWAGSATGTRTMNEVYSAMADLLDEPTQGDDATCMTADTPVEYTIGAIDANDSDPWYITYECLQHLTGGSLQTTGWAHVDGSATGIIVVPVLASSNNIVVGDYGLDVSGATDGNGTLLEILAPSGGTEDYLVIRPDTNAAGDQFTTDTQVITCNSLTAAQVGAVSNTGEQVWANPYTVTTIDSDTHLYVYRGTVADAARTRVLDVNDSNNTDAQDWWPEGSFDRCVYLNDFTDSALSIIDGGYMYFWARKGNTLYKDWESLSSASGGHNPVALSAAADGNNTTGYQSITLASGTVDDFTVGQVITGASSGAKGVITQVDGSWQTYTLHYYLIGDPMITFNTAAEIITSSGTGSATKNTSAPANQGAALSTWFTSNSVPVVTYGSDMAAYNVDIDNDGLAEGWNVEIDCSANPLTEVYEWIKYITRNGGQTTGNTDGIEGEQYLGPTVYLEYTTAISGTMTEGNDVTQAGSGATGIIVSSNTTDKTMVLRDVRGTFNTSGVVTDNDASGTLTPDITAAAFAPVSDSPLGTLAGGRFFGARGVLLINYLAADENSFQLIDETGTGRQRPTAFTLSVSNLVGTDETTATDDYVSMHRLLGSGLAIDKTEYTCTGGEAIGDTTIDVDSNITLDTAGESTGGVLTLVDVSDSNTSYRLRYSSWTAATEVFNLANIDLPTVTAATTTTITETGAFTNAKRGDLVLNKSQSDAVSYIDTVDSANSVTISPAIAGQGNGDNIEINAVPVIISASDQVYVSFIEEYATSAISSVSLVYNAAEIFYRVKVSNTRNATKIKRFVTDGSTTGTDKDTATIRNTDSIHQ